MAGCIAVAWIYIHMFAPEAFWAVVSVSITDDGDSAIATGKVLYILFERITHPLSIALPLCYLQLLVHHLL